MGEKAKWEAKQANVSARRAVKQAEFAMYRAAKGLAAPSWDTKSDTSEATVSTVASTMVFGSEEARCLASQDKEVRKLEKVLHEIAKLEERQHLDALQKAKVARKPEVQAELERVRGLAEACARNALRRQDAHCSSNFFASLD